MGNLEKTAKSLLAAGALSSLALEGLSAEGVEKQSESYSPKYKDAMIEMHEKVQATNKESGAIRVLYQNGNEKFYWNNQGSSDHLSFDPKRIEKISNEKTQEIEIIHTHPNENRDKGGDTSPAPPSSQDIWQAIITTETHPETEFKFSALDNYGVWSFNPNVDNPRIGVMSEHLIKLESFVKRFRAAHKSSINDNILFLLVNIDRPDFQDLAENFLGKTGPEFKKEWEDLLKNRKELSEKYPEIKEIDEFGLSLDSDEYKKNPQPHIKRYIDACKKMGIDVHFEAIDKFKN